MTERFIVDDAGTLIDMQTRDMFDIVEEVVDLLNKQHETIQRLKENIDELLSVNVEEELVKENEQLKTQLQNTCDQRDEFHRGARENANRVGKLEKEIEQLKKENGWLKSIHFANDVLKENKELKIQLQEKYQDLTELGLKYGDIIDIKIANEVIENQRKHIKEVEKENEQLKQQVQKIHNLIDKKMEECIVFNDEKSVLALSELKQRVIRDD